MWELFLDEMEWKEEEEGSERKGTRTDPAPSVLLIALL